MLLFALGTAYVALATTIVASLLFASTLRRGDRLWAVEDAEQMRLLRPERAPMTGTGVFSTQS